jgi:two-component system, cell cycle response regulator
MTAPLVLNVDDSALVRGSVARVLESYECRLVQAGDGAQGLELACNNPPDLILLDYNMPVLDGVGMLQALRKNPAGSRMKVILLTANASPDLLLTVARLGVRDYLIKPFTPEALVAKISRQIPLNRRAAS